MSTTTTTSYVFACTESELQGKCLLVATTEAQLKNAVHDALVNSMEHAVVKQNGTFLDNLYHSLSEKSIHRAALVRCLKDRFPFDFDKDEEKFKFKQRKAVAMMEAKKKTLAMPEHGQPFAEADMVVLWEMCNNYLDIINWMDYKQNTNTKTEKPKMTQEQLDKKVATLQKQAEDAGLKVALPSKAVVTEMPQGYGDYQAEFDALYQVLLSADDANRSMILSFIKTTCENHAKQVING